MTAAGWQLPLQGVRVIDFSLLLPGPFATNQLAQMWAEVIKLEPPGGIRCVWSTPSALRCSIAASSRSARTCGNPKGGPLSRRWSLQLTWWSRAFGRVFWLAPVWDLRPCPRAIRM